MSVSFVCYTKGVKPYSDNKEVNRYIKEVYVRNVPENFDSQKITICFGLKSKKTGRYYNYIRIGDESKGPSGYVEILSHLYDTYQEAISASKTYKGIIESKVGLLKCDFLKYLTLIQSRLFVIIMISQILIILLI